MAENIRYLMELLQLKVLILRVLVLLHHIAMCVDGQDSKKEVLDQDYLHILLNLRELSLALRIIISIIENGLLEDLELVWYLKILWMLILMKFQLQQLHLQVEDLLEWYLLSLNNLETEWINLYRLSLDFSVRL